MYYCIYNVPITKLNRDIDFTITITRGVRYHFTVVPAFKAHPFSQKIWSYQESGLSTYKREELIKSGFTLIGGLKTEGHLTCLNEGVLNWSGHCIYHVYNDMY